jgi:hypothetical protein
MIRSLRRLSLVALALGASFALSAQAAQAVEFHVEAEGANIPVTGAYPTKEENPSEEEAITFSFGTTHVFCLTATFTGTLPFSTATTMTLHPELNRCLATSLTMGGCDLSIGAAGTLAVTGNVECSLKPIEIISGCRYQIGPQEGLKTVSYANSGSGTSRDVIATFAVTGITYVKSGPGCGSSKFNNGELTGIVTLKADTAEEKQQGLWVE